MWKWCNNQRLQYNFHKWHHFGYYYCRILDNNGRNNFGATKKYDRCTQIFGSKWHIKVIKRKKKTTWSLFWDNNIFVPCAHRKIQVGFVFHSHLLIKAIHPKLYKKDPALAECVCCSLFWPKVIHPKYSKHWPYTVPHTIDCVCSKMLNRGLNHRLFLPLFKLIPCPIYWIVFVLAYLNFIFES